MNASDARKAHKILDDLIKGNMVLDEECEFLRSALPERPRQMTLKEIVHDVYEAWIASSGDEWIRDGVVGSVISLEDWLKELHEQLKGLKDTPAVSPVKPAHPEFLETEADYRKAPEGTIVACEGSSPWYKSGPEWSSVDFWGVKDNRGMSRARRRVLRWGQ